MILSSSSKRNTFRSSDSRSNSCKSYKLRTIYKGRGSQQGFMQEQFTPKNHNNQSLVNSKLSQVNNRPLSSSMKIGQSISKVSLAQTAKSVSQNTIRIKETLNCEQQLLGKQDFQQIYTKLNKQLDELIVEADNLIQMKIRKISKKMDHATLKEKGRDEISIKIQKLIQKVKGLQQKKLQKYKDNQQKVRKFIDKKIQLLEKLIAESLTQSQLLKSHFFAINSLRSQQKQAKKIKNSTVTTKLKESRNFLVPINKRSKTQSKQSFFHQSSNKVSYNAPKAEQYQTFRYKVKQYSANTQPLPRSSYKRQFLIYDQKQKQSPIKNLDNFKPFNKTRQNSTTYAKDYQRMKTDIFNYKELDSYKNKIKNVQLVFFEHNRKEKQHKQFQLSKSYMKQQIQDAYRPKNNKKMSLNKSLAQNLKQLELKPAYKNSIISTQAKSQYKGQQKQISSNIKHRRLNNLKYAYKSLVNE